MLPPEQVATVEWWRRYKMRKIPPCECDRLAYFSE